MLRARLEYLQVLQLKDLQELMVTLDTTAMMLSLKVMSNLISHAKYGDGKILMVDRTTQTEVATAVASTTTTEDPFNSAPAGARI